MAARAAVLPDHHSEAIDKDPHEDVSFVTARYGAPPIDVSCSYEVVSIPSLKAHSTVHAAVSTIHPLILADRQVDLVDLLDLTTAIIAKMV